MKKLIIITSGIALSALSSCNTIAGAGQDLQRGGAAVTGAAQDVASRAAQNAAATATQNATNVVNGVSQ